MSVSPYLVRARVLTGYCDLVRSQGGDPLVLLSEVGIPPTLVNSPNSAFPVQTFASLMLHSAEVLAMPDFGLRMAGYQDLTVLGAIALIALNAETVGDALDSISRNMAFHSPALQSRKVHEGERVRAFLYHDINLQQAARRQITEHLYFNTVSIVRRLAQVPGKDWGIDFDFQPSFPIEHYEAMYGCEVRFMQAANCLILPADILDIRIQSANPELRKSGEQYVRSALRRHPLDIARRVEDLVNRHMGTARYTLPVIAQQLAISPQTLQRQLAELGTCFEDIVDGIRRQRAEEMLPMTAMPLQSIADFLGYSSQTSFTRACRRWFGEPPQALRSRSGRAPRVTSADD